MDFDHPDPDPLVVFEQWYAAARQTALPNPNAMTLATADVDGRPSARIVLLKEIDQKGAVFHTHREGRKGRELEANPHAALVFHWDELQRQVRIEGEVSLVSDEESDAYFATRPRERQLGAWASRQSEPAADRAALDESVREAQQRFEGKPVPRPSHWGGYRVSLQSIEFWQGHEHRLHDRILYRRGDDGSWVVQRLFP